MTVWTCVVFDNTKTNVVAAKLLQEEFPKLFFNGCRTHCADLIIEDIQKIPEIKETVEQSRNMAVFIHAHDKVKAAYLRVGKPFGATLLTIYPLTRFAYACFTLEGTRGKN